MSDRPHRFFSFDCMSHVFLPRLRRHPAMYFSPSFTSAFLPSQKCCLYDGICIYVFSITADSE